MSTCPNCSKPLAAGRPKCFHCGFILAVTTPCARCQRPLAPTAARCVFCGTTATPKAAVSPPAAAASGPEAAKVHFERADRLGDEGRLEDALTEYDRALALDPGMAAAWSDKGHVLFKMERYEQALATLERAIGLSPSLLSAWNNKAACLVALQRPREAYEAAVHATTLAPRAALPWMNRARAAALLGRLDEAAAAYQRVLGMDVDRGTLDNARQWLASLGASAPSQAPRTVASWIEEGVRLGTANDIDGSMYALDHALALDTTAWAAWLNKAVTMAKAGFLVDALAYAEHAVDLAPSEAMPRALHRRITDVLAGTAPDALAFSPLPPGRFGATMTFPTPEAAAFSKAALVAAPGQLLEAATVSATHFFALVPGGAGREFHFDAIAAGRVGLVFRHGAVPVMPDEALNAHDRASLESLLAQERVARVIVCGNRPWAARTKQAIAEIDARLGSARLALAVLAT